MARHKNVDWELPDKLSDWEQANTAVLMDIRAELQMLNKLLGCSNFTGIPDTLHRIARNTAKPKRKKARTP